MLRTLLVLVLLAIAGCGDRRRAPGGDAGVGGSAAAAAVVDPGPPLAALDDAHLAALEAVAPPPGFAVTARDRTATSIVIALRGADLRATVTATPCLRCVPIALDRWRAIEPELRALLPGGLEDDPSTTFELAIAPVGGRACVMTYELGAASYNEELDTTHAARVYCNDGATEVVVRVDDERVARAATVDAARGAAERGRVEAAARELAAVYLASLAR